MTILTKQIVDEKKPDAEGKEKAPVFPTVEYTTPAAEPDFVSTGRTPSVAWGGDLPLDWYLSWRRRRLLTSLCAALLVLWLLLAAVIGGVLLFRYLHRKPVFYGWCGTTYLENGDNFGAPRYSRLEERVEVDEDNALETIRVPQFGPHRPAVFVHDFRQNLTGIVDTLGDQCFVKRLDRRHVSPPKSFIDLIEKMENGYYEQSTAVITERFRVRIPQMTEEELEALGSWMIARQCRHKASFMLEKRYRAMERPTRRRRSAEKTFMFFNGQGQVLETIVE